MLGTRRLEAAVPLHGAITPVTAAERDGAYPVSVTAKHRHTAFEGRDREGIWKVGGSSRN
jgi:hypothetical protein